jgi:hypothetical protein
VNYILLISTDHGMLKVTKDKVVEAEKFPEFQKMLNLPLAGEPRLPYCYVKPEEADNFTEYVQNKLGNYCDLFSRDEIIAKGWYGKGAENQRFRDRIGDFILVMKDNYILKDKVLGGSEVDFLGYHGGMSPAEMRIPLIILEEVN